MTRISTRLAVSFLLVALLPTLPLSLVVRNLLERRFGPAITEPVERALEAGLADSRARLREQQDRFAAQVARLAPDLDLPDRVLVGREGRALSTESLREFVAARPALASILARESGDVIGPAQIERFDDVLVARDDQQRIWLQPLPPDMVGRAQDITGAISLMRTLRQDQDRVVLSFVGPFLVVYGVLIVVALIVAFFWSRQIVGPLEKLVGATRRVARGDLEFRLPPDGAGEVRELVTSFDTMVGRLADQRRDLARLERAAAWRGMARTLAHEVKNPLTPILLAVNQARDKYPGGDPTYQDLLDEVVEIVGEEVESLRALVRDFGDFARLPKPQPRPGDMHELLEDLQHLYGVDRLAVPGPAAHLEGWFDTEALRRALVNLIDNGLAACRQAGTVERVEIAATAGDPGVVLRVVDRGSGIAAEHLARIFEPDFTTKNDGMGLGLAITENIVIGHGGRISVVSEPGAGTAFTLALPLTQPVASEQDEP